MRMENSGKQFLLSCLAATFAMQAQAAAPQAEQVIVTAVRRATKLERTPVTVSVVSGASIGRRGIREITQLSGTVPGLTLNQSPGGLPQVSVRGVGTSAANQVFEQSVALFVDGIYQPRARQYRDALFDLQQVEVIKGAQGVLYGKNSSVGVIAATTRGPGAIYAGTIGSEYETSYGTYATDAAVDLPFTPKLALRLAGLYSDDAGYVYNVSKHREEGGTVHFVGRATLVADLSDDFTATLKFQAGHLQTKGNLFEWVQTDNPDALKAYGIADGGRVPYQKYESTKPFPGTYDRQDSYLPSLILKRSFADGGSLTSTTGYSAFHFGDGYDSDASPAASPSVYSAFHEGFSQESEELRYASASGSRFSYQGGVFALHHDDSFDYMNDLNKFYLLPKLRALDVTGIGAQNFEENDVSVSGFLQGDLHITDTLALSLGGRLGQENKAGTYTKQILSTLGDPGSVISLISPLPRGPLSRRLDDTSFDYSAILSDQLTNTTLLYGSVSQGTKSGAFNNTAAFGQTLPTPFTVRPEVVASYEAGIKQGFWDDRGFLALDVYHLHIDGYQDSYYSSSALGFLVRSVNANTTGIEAEGRLRPNDALTLTANTSLEPQADITDGERLQRAPRFTAFLGAQLTHGIAPGWRGTANADLTYSTSYLNQSAIAPGDNNSGAYAIADLRIAATDIRYGLEFALRIDNLTDRRYIAYSYGSLLSTAYLPGEGGQPIGSVGIYNRPRTFTLSVRKDF